MKLLVFAHKPPPFHGQSYMVEQVLEILGGALREGASSAAAAGELPSPERQACLIECFHVDCRYSAEVGEVGRAGAKKVFLLLKYCVQAIWCRLRHGVTDMLYIPAPSVRTPLYRDWVVMALCRPFFRRRIFYWQAAGLGDWLAREARPWERGISRFLLGKPDLSIVLGEYCRADADYFASRTVAVIPNAIPDPCPDFETALRPARDAAVRGRLAAWTQPASADGTASGPRHVSIFRVLFIGICTREKGLFDALDAVAFANAELTRSRALVRIQLNVAGKFWKEDERREFDARLQQSDLAEPLDDSDTPAVSYAGFVGGDAKHELFNRCDCLCFPSYYPAESFGIVLIEAMAYGLHIVTSRWRTIPELFPPGFPGLVEPRQPQQIAAALLACARTAAPGNLREHFLKHFAREQFTRKLVAALLAR